MVKYTYSELIDAYFRSIKYSLSRFSTSSCREYVQKWKGKHFDNERFLKELAISLSFLDDNLSDYSLDSDYEKT